MNSMIMWLTYHITVCVSYFQERNEPNSSLTLLNLVNMLTSEQKILHTALLSTKSLFTS